MAWTVTWLTGSGEHSGSTTTTTASVSPSADAMLVLDVSHLTTGGYTIDSVSDTFSGSGTWTLRETAAVVGNRLTRTIWECQMGASPGTGTVTITFSNSGADHRGWALCEITNSESGTITYVDSDSDGLDTNSDPTSISLSGYTTGNICVSGLSGRGQAPLAPNASETELGEFQCSAGGNHNQGQMQYAESGTASWTDLNTSSNRWASWYIIEYELVSAGDTRTAEAASVTATAQDAEASAEITVTAQHGSVTATAQDSEHSASIDVAAQGASVTATAQDASYTIGAVARTAQHASVTATAQEPAVTIGSTSRTAEHGSVTATAKDAVASVSITVTAQHGSVTATAKDATASASIDVTASKGSVTAAAQEPTVTIGATERTAEKASVTTTAKDASTSAAAATRTAEKATVTATAQDASFEAAIGVTAEHGSVQATAKDATATSSTVTDERTAEKATVTATAQDASYTIGDTSRTALHASVQATASDATATAVFNATALKASVSANANDAVAEAVAQIEALAASVSAIARAPSFTIGATSRTAVKATVTATAKDAVAASGLDPVNPITIDRYSGGITVNNRTVLAANMSQATLTIDMDTTQETDKSNHPMRIDK